MNENRIELFSLESFFMNVFAGVLTLMAVIQFLGMISRWKFAKLNDRFDAFIEWVHQSCEVLPWIMFAAIIAIVTPVYDIFLDGGWISVTRGMSPGHETFLEVWRKLLNEDSAANSKRDLIHVLQWACAFAMFYLYSLMWVRVLRMSERRGKYPRDKVARAAFFGGFAILMGLASQLVSYMGQNANFVLL